MCRTVCMHCVLIGRRILPCVGCVWTHSGTIDYIKWFNIKPNPLSIVISGLLLLVHIGYGIAILVTQGMVMLVVLVFSSSSAIGRCSWCHRYLFHQKHRKTTGSCKTPTRTPTCHGHSLRFIEITMLWRACSSWINKSKAFCHKMTRAIP